MGLTLLLCSSLDGFVIALFMFLMWGALELDKSEEKDELKEELRQLKGKLENVTRELNDIKYYNRSRL